MLKRIIKKIIRFVKYCKSINGINSFFCIIDEIFKVERIRLIKINNFSIYIRTNTPDLLVAISSLYDNEYDNVRSLNPKVIIDAGANIGTSSIFFAKKYPEAQIFAIEPESSNYNLLLRNTKEYQNIVPIQSAIWGTVDKKVIQNRFTGHWGYTIANTSNKVETTGQEIDCITIDVLMRNYDLKWIDLLKIDIEGSEKDVFENSQEWIDSVNVIIVELHDRITMGCDRAFYLATQNFRDFEKHGEKVTAYR